MTKQQFLHELTVQLNLNVSDARIREQLQYYDRYISDEMAKGRSEEQITEELGAPRLLARTIIEAAEADGDRVALQDEEIRGTIDTEPNSSAFDDYHTADNPYREPNSAGGTAETSYQSHTGETGDGRDTVDTGSEQNAARNRVFMISGLGCLVIVLLLIAFFQILVYIVGGIFQVLNPVLLPLIIFCVVLWMFKGMFKP